VANEEYCFYCGHYETDHDVDSKFIKEKMDNLLLGRQKTLGLCRKTLGFLSENSETAKMLSKKNNAPSFVRSQDYYV
jgi:hypothetical protein